MWCVYLYIFCVELSLFACFGSFSVYLSIMLIGYIDQLVCLSRPCPLKKRLFGVGLSLLGRLPDYHEGGGAHFNGKCLFYIF